MNFFTRIFLQIDQQTEIFISANAELAAAYATPFVIAAGTILIIGTGLAMMMGQIQTPAKDMILALGTVALVAALATGIGNYNLYFRDLLTGLPDDLIGLAGGVSAGEQLDAFGESILGGIQKMFKSSSGVVAGFKAVLASLLMLVIWIIMSVAAFLMLLLSKVGLAVLVGVGPVFIALAIHPATREYFTKWLSYCTNFAFLALLVGGVLSMISSVAQEYFDSFQDSDGRIDFVVMAAPAIIMGALVGIFSQLPTIASSLGGGIGLSAGNFAGNAVSKLSEPVRRNLHKATGGQARENSRNAKIQEDTRVKRQQISRKRIQKAAA